MLESLEERRVMTTDLISSASDGTQGNGDAYASSISANGRYVAFESSASNLVAGNTKSTMEIFLKDTVSGVTTLISSASDGTIGNDNSSTTLSISADGRYVVFESSATNLVAGDTNISSDIFLKDTVTGITTLISSASDGTIGNDFSIAPSISADGHYVAFQSNASNLVAGDTNNKSDIFLKDTVSGVITLISTASDGTKGNGGSSFASISTDGHYVSFSSRSSNLVAGDTNNTSDIFLKDTVSGVITLVSTASDGTKGNGGSFDNSISADGRYIAFASVAQNLMAGDTNRAYDIFFRDTVSGVTTLVSKAPHGTIGNGESTKPFISADGRYISFDSEASNLVAGDTNNSRDVFLYDTVSGVTALISTAFDGTLGNMQSLSGGSISADGRYVTFQSDASNLVAGDTNKKEDVFRVNNPLYNIAPTLTATLTTGSLAIADIQPGGTPNYLGINRIGANLEITDSHAQFVSAPTGGTLSNNNQTLTIPLALITNGITINTGAGDDTITVDTTDLVPTILTKGVNIDFGDGNDTLTLINKKTNNMWTIDGNKSGNVKVKNAGVINFQNLENAAGGTGSDVFRIQSTFPMNMSLNSGNGGGSDSLEVVRDADFTLDNTKLIIDGAALAQTFTLANIQLATLTGGAGNNFINAKVFTGSLRLNGGDGNDVLLGGSGNDILNGGNGNDWLTGNGGDDTLLGWNGRDILVGGTGSDKLNDAAIKGSDNGDDLLIGGRTLFDNVKSLIDLLLTSWTNPYFYTGHVDKFTISGIGPNGRYKFDNSTIIDDNAVDILYGGSGTDWFFAGTSGSNKDTHDRTGIEQVVGV